MTLKSVNPTSLELIQTYELDTLEVLHSKLEKAQDYFSVYKKTCFDQRKEILTRLSDLLKQQKEELAKLMTNEMGKKIKEALGEIEKCALVCDYYADNAEKFLQNRSISTNYSQSYVTYLPIGPILAIMPWNFPFWQVFRFLAPTIMAGNTSLLKHASNVTGCALAIEKLVQEASNTDALLQVLKVPGSQLTPIIENPKIKAVSLTGSTEAGQKVAQTCGKSLKKCVLELGGSDAYIICEDTMLERALESVMSSRLLNSGQSCIAAKRMIIHESLFENFINQLKAKLENYQPSDPLSEACQLAPMARVDLRDDLHTQVQRAISHGAKCLFGGSIPQTKGSYYTPTILTDISEDNQAFCEEFFGPVFCLYSYREFDQALSLANKTPFGLGSAIFTYNESYQKRAVTELEAGSTFINDFVKSDPRLPFGGVKQSGYGRELSCEGILEFVNTKTICLK